MVKEDKRLTHDDIKALIDSPDTGTKIQVIEKLSSQYNRSDFTQEQIQLAEQIFRLLLKEAEVEVRKALSTNLMSNRNIPHDVVYALAKDVEQVSLPVLQFSDVLTDADLVEIISSSQSAGVQVSVASRANVSEEVSTALIDTKNEAVITNLLRNDGAKISDAGYTKVVDTFSESERMVEMLVTRGSLSPKVIEHMTQKVSQAIQQKLEGKYKSNFASINDFFRESAEVAALKFREVEGVDVELMDLVDDLERTNKMQEALEPNFGMLTQLLDGLEHLGRFSPISGLINGHLTLFEIGLSRATGVPLVNVKKLVVDTEGGLRALYERANLPMNMYEAVRFITGVIIVMEKEAKANPQRRPRFMLQLLLKRIIDESVGKNIPKLSHLTTMIRTQLENRQGEW